ncbi:hypothetical protein LJR290_007706 [Variovorax sp. LjRoot290]|uniref:hypothetical protein n=1 Tax=Variovorax sp. LjRoot290 TaxID=3342316 RepID=UPI003ECE6C5C
MKKFIALLALCPWIAYFLLSFVASHEDAKQFVSASLWFATPVLVLVAALRAYDEGIQRGRSGARGSSASANTIDHSAFQTTQLGQLN